MGRGDSGRRETAVRQSRKETADRVAKYQTDDVGRTCLCYVVLVPQTAAAASKVLPLCHKLPRLPRRWFRCASVFLFFRFTLVVFCVFVLFCFVCHISGGTAPLFHLLILIIFLFFFAAFVFLCQPTWCPVRWHVITLCSLLIALQ